MSHHLEAMRSAIGLSRRISDADEFGGLHIVVADGNVEDEDVEFCITQTDSPLTDEERLLAEDLLYREEEIRALAYWLSSAPGEFVADLERRLGSADPGIPILRSTDATDQVMNDPGVEKK